MLLCNTNKQTMILMPQASLGLAGWVVRPHHGRHQRYRWEFNIIVLNTKSVDAIFSRVSHLICVPCGPPQVLTSVWNKQEWLIFHDSHFFGSAPTFILTLRKHSIPHFFVFTFTQLNFLVEVLSPMFSCRDDCQWSTISFSSRKEEFLLALLCLLS